jgi:hypothetical protein
MNSQGLKGPQRDQGGKRGEAARYNVVFAALRLCFLVRRYDWATGRKQRSLPPARFLYEATKMLRVKKGPPKTTGIKSS